MKEKLTTSQVLIFPKQEEPREVYYNVSYQGLGCVLMQHKQVGGLCFKETKGTRQELPHTRFGACCYCLCTKDMKALSIWLYF